MIYLVLKNPQIGLLGRSLLEIESLQVPYTPEKSCDFKIQAETTARSWTLKSAQMMDSWSFHALPMWKPPLGRSWIF